MRTIVYTLAVGLSVGTVASRTVSAGELDRAPEAEEEREFSLYGGAALSLGEDIEAESGLPVCGAALTMGEDLTLEQLPYIPQRERQPEEEEVCAEAEAEEESPAEPAYVEAVPAVSTPSEAAPAAQEAAAAAETPAAEEPAAETPAAEEPVPEAEEPAAEAEPEAPAEEEPGEETPSDQGDAAMGQQVADFALQFVGGPYKYGGSSLTEGSDCSGFVMAVYANFGVSLPHSSTADRGVGRHVDGGLTGAVPGDIICYNGHVGIYIGNGLIVHAFNSRKGIVTTNADYDTVLEVRRIF